MNEGNPLELFVMDVFLKHICSICNLAAVECIKHCHSFVCYLLEHYFDKILRSNNLPSSLFQLCNPYLLKYLENMIRSRSNFKIISHSPPAIHYNKVRNGKVYTERQLFAEIPKKAR